MPSIDDQLKARMRESAPRPAGAGDLVGKLGARKRRRATTRKLGTIGLVAAVLIGTVGGFVALGRTFRTGPSPAGPAPTAANGALVVSIPNEGSFHLMVLPPDAQDLDPSDGTTEAGFASMDALTWEGGTQDSEPAISPDGRTVAFVRKDATDVPPSLWLVDIDGTHEHPITRAPADVRSPAWSPDGSMIAFSAANEPEGRALYTIHPDGSDLHLVVDGPVVGGLAWSPDGTSIVFDNMPSLDGGPSDLWVTSADGSEVRQLTVSPEASEVDPTWSPDGNTIAYIAKEGIEEIPEGGGESSVVVPSLVGDDGVGRSPQAPAWSPDGSFLTFIRDPGMSPGRTTVYALPTGASDAFALVQGTSFAWQPLPLASQTPSTAADLGLDVPICRVMSMPITVAGAPGTAYVFTRATDVCPKPGEGDRFVAADLNGDGIVETPPVKLSECFPPVGCETFAAPDVNGDGTSEIAVSEAGADGYGVRLFALTTSPPSIEPIDVVDPEGIGNVQTGALQFAWVDVVGHAELARCDAAPDGATFTVQSVDHVPPDAVVRSTVLRVDGTIATVIDATKERVAIGDAPAPGNTLCDGPIYGSASNFPQAPPGQGGTNIGLDAPLCNISDMTADVTGDQRPDTIWVGTQVQQDGRCPDAFDATNAVAVDVTGDGLADTSSTAVAYCVSCAPFGTIDFDADGTNELVVTEQAGSEIQYGVFAVRPTGGNGAPRIAPVLVADPGDPKGGFDAGKPFTFWAGGDEGRDEFVRCDSYPAAPVMVLTQTSHPIEGPGSDTKTVHVTRLQMQADGLIYVVGVDEYTQSTSDPLTFPIPTTACGLRLDLYL